MPRLHIDEVLEGMVLSEDIISTINNKVLLKKGTKLKKDFINALKERKIFYLEIFDRYTLRVNPIESTVKELNKLITEQILYHSPEIKEANTNDKMVEISKNARKLLSSILKNKTAMKLCLDMKILDNTKYYRHAINTCAFSLLVALAMELPEEEAINIGIAALLHDIGLCEMPAIVFKRTENLTSQEEALWKEHTNYGYYAMREAGISEKISKMVMHHHEHWDGSGFPMNLEGENIPLGSRIIAICQTFDELISIKQLPHYEAIEYLYGAGGFYFDSEIIRVFTESIAVYPMGSMVRLTTGEVGVVVNIRSNKGPRPIVRIYYNSFNKVLKEAKEIDLGKQKTIFIKEVL
ncbi:MAG: HD domain-containing protein [Fusobacteria bacterium]|nr:HD domain-containing protein [Fusobacteriota bacterium]